MVLGGVVGESAGGRNPQGVRLWPRSRLAPGAAHVCRRGQVQTLYRGSFGGSSSQDNYGSGQVTRYVDWLDE